MDSGLPLLARARWATAVCTSWHGARCQQRCQPCWVAPGEGCAQGQPRLSWVLVLLPKDLPLRLVSTPFSMSEMGF